MWRLAIQPHQCVASQWRRKKEDGSLPDYIKIKTENYARRYFNCFEWRGSFVGGSWSLKSSDEKVIDKDTRRC